MPRPEKVQAVAEIKERLEGSSAVFMAEYAGLSVKEQRTLRRALSDAEGDFKVYKMTLARIAATELGRDEMLEMLVGPTGLTFARGDAAATAKVLRDFSKDHARLIIKGALLGTEVLTPERVAALADLEPRDVLLAKIAGALQAPMAAMAGLMAAMPRNLASMIKQLIDKSPAPAPEAAASEAEEASAPEAEEASAPAAAAVEESAAEAAVTGDEAPAEATTTDNDAAAPAETITEDETAVKAEEE
jgi:large subunit ribosomal protein L10